MTSAKGHATLTIVSKQPSQEDFCFAEKGEQDYDRTKLLGSTDELRITSLHLLRTVLVSSLLKYKHFLYY